MTLYIIRDFCSCLDEISSQLSDVITKISESAVVTCFNQEDATMVRNSLGTVRIVASLKEIVCCKICLDISSTPIVISGCCKQPLGCEPCLETWLETSRQCPHCRSEELDNIHVNFLDDLINDLKRL